MMRPVRVRWVLNRRCPIELGLGVGGLAVEVSEELLHMVSTYGSNHFFSQREVVVRRTPPLRHEDQASSATSAARVLKP